MLRKNFTAFAASIAISVGCSASAFAGDLFAPSIKDDAIERSVSWTGIYVGVHGGWAEYDNDFPGLKEFPDGPPNPDLSGAYVGGQITGLYQFNKIVVGATADISFTDIEDTVRDGNALTEETKLDRFGTVRGILGVAVGRFLPYATVGWAWADAEYNEICPQGQQSGLCRPFAGPNLTAFGPYNVKGDDTLNGVAYGAGIKYAINEHFSIGVEYLKLDFDDGLFVLPALANGKNPTDKPFDLESDSVKVQVDYKF